MFCVPEALSYLIAESIYCYRHLQAVRSQETQNHCSPSIVAEQFNHNLKTILMKLRNMQWNGTHLSGVS